jgi:hypothetical protein
MGTYFGGAAVDITLFGDGGPGDTTVTIDLMDVLPVLAGRNFYSIHVQSYISLNPSTLTLSSLTVDGTKATFVWSAGLVSAYLTIIPFYTSL